MRYAGAAVGRQSNGRMFIIDVMRGIFAPSTQALRVVQLAKKHDARQVTIVDTPGARHIEHHIHNAALAENYKLMLRWVENDDEPAARDLRLRSTEPLLSSNRLRFSDEISCMPDLVRQFTNFGMVEENEIVEVIARVCESLPKSIAHPEAVDDEDDAMQEQMDQDMHNKVYGLGVYAVREQPIYDVPEPDHEPPSNGYGLDDIMPGLSG
jgi:hypothetical protein